MFDLTLKIRNKEFYSYMWIMIRLSGALTLLYFHFVARSLLRSLPNIFTKNNPHAFFFMSVRLSHIANQGIF